MYEKQNTMKFELEKRKPIVISTSDKFYLFISTLCGWKPNKKDKRKLLLHKLYKRGT